MADIKFPRSHSYFITLNHIYLIAFIFLPRLSTTPCITPRRKQKMPQFHLFVIPNQGRKPFHTLNLPLKTSTKHGL